MTLLICFNVLNQFINTQYSSSSFFPFCKIRCSQSPLWSAWVRVRGFATLLFFQDFLFHIVSHINELSYSYFFSVSSSNMSFQPISISFPYSTQVTKWSIFSWHLSHFTLRSLEYLQGLHTLIPNVLDLKLNMIWDILVFLLWKRYSLILNSQNFMSLVLTHSPQQGTSILPC